MIKVGILSDQIVQGRCRSSSSCKSKIKPNNPFLIHSQPYLEPLKCQAVKSYYLKGNVGKPSIRVVFQHFRKNLIRRPKMEVGAQF